jgi:hypothetical protein
MPHVYDQFFSKNVISMCYKLVIFEKIPNDIVSSRSLLFIHIYIFVFGRSSRVNTTEKTLKSHTWTRWKPKEKLMISWRNFLSAAKKESEGKKLSHEEKSIKFFISVFPPVYLNWPDWKFIQKINEGLCWHFCEN